MKVVTVFELGCMCVCALRGRVQHIDVCTHAAAPVDPAAAAPAQIPDAPTDPAAAARLIVRKSVRSATGVVSYQVIDTATGHQVTQTTSRVLGKHEILQDMENVALPSSLQSITPSHTRKRTSPHKFATRELALIACSSARTSPSRLENVTLPSSLQSIMSSCKEDRTILGG